jgi:RNA polymerase sigma-70 factor (ECF subfamily)
VPLVEVAFARAWAAARPAVESFIATLVPRAAEAEDLLQNVAEVLLRKAAEYDGERSFTAWAIGVARYEVLGARRRHERSLLTFDSDMVDRIAQASEELADDLALRREALLACLERVGGRSREALRLRYAEGRAAPEIAEALRMRAVAVRVMLMRTRAALEKCIAARLAPRETA